MRVFVYMIPVIAFFGTGKVPAAITVMVFGGTPVVRLTVLGLRGVPESIREAAIAYGASNWYLLSKVDLPLAAPSIRAGMNQTILLSLAMVVVVSLIGAKGLGEDVLEALTHDARPASDPARVPGARLVELSVRLHVDGVARAERDQLQVSSDPIDDPETPHPIAAEALEFVAERLAGAGILEKRLECGPNLAFEHRMKAANQCRDLVRNSQTAWRRHPVVFRRLYSNSSSSV